MKKTILFLIIFGLSVFGFTQNKTEFTFKNKSAIDFTKASSTSTDPAYGNVVFKIGENGISTKAGAKFNDKVNESGMLYLSIYETVFNASNTGYYIVKLKLK